MKLRDAALAGVGALILLGPVGLPSGGSWSFHWTGQAWAQAVSQPPAGKSPAAKSLASPRVAPPSRETPGSPHTLAEALAATYSYQPVLQAERAKLRATDESLPQALAGWRPTVILGAGVGTGDGESRAYSVATGSTLNAQTARDIAQAQATVTQPIYTGGKVSAQVNHAKNAVMAERANLIVQEEQSFSDTVNAYVGVIQAQQLLALNINNEQVLQAVGRHQRSVPGG